MRHVLGIIHVPGVGAGGRRDVAERIGFRRPGARRGFPFRLGGQAALFPGAIGSGVRPGHPEHGAGGAGGGQGLEALVIIVLAGLHVELAVGDGPFRVVGAGGLRELHVIFQRDLGLVHVKGVQRDIRRRAFVGIADGFRGAYAVDAGRDKRQAGGLGGQLGFFLFVEEFLGRFQADAAGGVRALALDVAHQVGPAGPAPELRAQLAGAAAKQRGKQEKCCGFHGGVPLETIS